MVEPASRQTMIDYLVKTSGAKGLIPVQRARRNFAGLPDAELQTLHDNLKAAAARAAALLARVDLRLAQERKAAAKSRQDAALSKLDALSARIRLRRGAAARPANG